MHDLNVLSVWLMLLVQCCAGTSWIERNQIRRATLSFAAALRVVDLSDHFNALVIMGFSFGSFDKICTSVALIPCPLLGTSQGLEPSCYSRNVQLGSQLIFQPGE